MNDTASGPQDPAADRPGRSLAEKTEWLIQRMWPPDVPEAKTNAEVADAICKVTGEELSYTAIWKLRTGRGDNPTLRTLTALATFFKVPISYFGDGEEAESVGDQVALLALLRESGVNRTALRSLVELSDESRQMITEMIESAARMERRRAQDGE